MSRTGCEQWNPNPGKKKARTPRERRSVLCRVRHVEQDIAPDILRSTSPLPCRSRIAVWLRGCGALGWAGAGNDARQSEWLRIGSPHSATGKALGTASEDLLCGISR